MRASSCGCLLSLLVCHENLPASTRLCVEFQCDQPGAGSGQVTSPGLGSRLGRACAALGANTLQ